MTDTFTCSRCGMGGIVNDAAHTLFHDRIGDPLPPKEPEPDSLAVELWRIATGGEDWNYGPNNVPWGVWHDVAAAARRMTGTYVTEPYLGLATTRELLEEVKARMQSLLGYAVAQQLYSVVNTALGSTALEEYLTYRTVGIEWRSGHDTAAAAVDG